MTRRAPICHPDRRYGAHGLCRACYVARWKRGEYRATAERTCKLCPATFTPSIAYQEHCSEDCRRRQRSLSRACLEPDVETTVARSASVAAELAGAYVARGCRLVSRRAAVAKLRDVDGWVKAWRSRGLYIVRARLPAEYMEAA